MSLIHLDKSVLTFHFKEILEDGHLGGPLTIVGLSALVLGPKLLSKLIVQPVRLTKPQVSSAYHPPMSLAEWVTHAKRREISPTDLDEAHGMATVHENSIATKKIAA